MQCKYLHISRRLSDDDDFCPSPMHSIRTLFRPIGNLTFVELISSAFSKHHTRVACMFVASTQQVHIQTHERAHTRGAYYTLADSMHGILNCMSAKYSDTDVAQYIEIQTDKYHTIISRVYVYDEGHVCARVLGKKRDTSLCDEFGVFS